MSVTFVLTSIQFLGPVSNMAYKFCQCKGRFTHRQRATTVENSKGLLEIIQRSYCGKIELLLMGPQVYCKVKVDHVEGPQHIRVQVLTVVI